MVKRSIPPQITGIMKLIRYRVDCSETRIFPIMSTGTQKLLQTIESIKVIGFVRQSKWSPLRSCRGSVRARHRWDAWDRLKCLSVCCSSLRHSTAYYIPSEVETRSHNGSCKGDLKFTKWTGIRMQRLLTEALISKCRKNGWGYTLRNILMGFFYLFFPVCFCLCFV